MTGTKERPTAVSVIGWFWRVAGAIGMIAAIPYALWGQDIFVEYWADALLRLSPTFLFFWAFLSSLLGFLMGNGILKGKDWARKMAVGYCLAATMIGAVFYKANFVYWVNLIGNLVFTAVMWFFLYRPKATAFFRGEEPLAG